jgi:hypothetical protein
MLGGELLWRLGDQTGDKTIVRRLAPVRCRWRMASMCEAKTMETGGQGVRHRNGACCPQKMQSAMCRQET